MTAAGVAERLDAVEAAFRPADARKTLVLVVIAAFAYLASRVPLMVLGFGRDSDAWSVASVAADLVRRGEYHVSRAPGHPVHEAINAVPIAFGGPMASNALTLLFSAGLLVVVVRLGRALGLSRSYWAAGILAVHPLFWIASADSTDFTLAALLGTSSLLAGLTGSWKWAGILLGLGVGTRIELAVFALPLVVLSGRPAWWRALAVAGFTAVVCYLPVLLTYRDAPWSLGDLYTSALEPTSRVSLFVTSIWAAVGLLPGLAVGAALFAGRKTIVSLASRKDPLLKATTLLAMAYIAVTLVHPSKPSYFVPFLPVAVLFLTRVAPAAWRVVILAAFLSYGFVYPDIIDRVGSSVSVGFRWNNGLVVKEWIARWNASHAAHMIAANRPSACNLMVLGYWLPIWRWHHLEATPVRTLTPGVEVDPRVNAAFAGRDHVVAVHKLDRPASAAVASAGIRQCYGEGIDGFLQDTYGYDIREFGATQIRVRDLGSEVSERFTLPILLSCAGVNGSWRKCIQSYFGGRDAVGTRPS